MAIDARVQQAAEVARLVFQAPRRLAVRARNQLMKRKAQVPTSVWALYAPQHRAANQAMMALLAKPSAPAAAAPAAAAPTKTLNPASPPGSPASVLATPSRAGLSKESVARRLVALVRTPASVSSAADSTADSLASHPIDEADEAATAAASAPRSRRPGRAALRFAAALVPVAVAAAAVAGRQRPAASQPASRTRRASLDCFPEPREVPFATPKPNAFMPRT